MPDASGIEFESRIAPSTGLSSAKRYPLVTRHFDENDLHLVATCLRMSTCVKLFRGREFPGLWVCSTSISCAGRMGQLFGRVGRDLFSVGRGQAVSSFLARELNPSPYYPVLRHVVICIAKG
jgi:hypothetical protein